MAERSRQKSVGIFFGTVSGRSAKLAQYLSARFSGTPTDCGRSLGLPPFQEEHRPISRGNKSTRIGVSVLDLAATPVEKLTEFPVQIWISPTYGKGDLQYHWLQWAENPRPFDLSNQFVFPIALGDQRHHRKTFGGAFEKLVDLAFSMRASVCVPAGRNALAEARPCLQCSPGSTQPEYVSRPQPGLTHPEYSQIWAVGTAADRSRVLENRFVLDFVSARAQSANRLNAWLEAFQNIIFPM